MTKEEYLRQFRLESCLLNPSGNHEHPSAWLNQNDPVDLALITTPANTIPSVLEDCGKKGIPGAVIIAGGFRELGEDGKNLEQNLVKVAKENNVRIIGPR